MSKKWDGEALRKARVKSARKHIEKHYRPKKKRKKGKK